METYYVRFLCLLQKVQGEKMIYYFDLRYKGKFIDEIEIDADDEIQAENRAYDYAVGDIEVNLVKETDNEMR